VVGTEIAVFALLSVLFALAIASAVSARQKEAAQAREMAAAAARDAEYRDLLVQEMKHRIKNYITRIQSIARQSAVGATDVKAFSETFTARLRSMAAVQEILAGTVTPQAEVRRILARELQQAVDSDMVERMLDGPDIRLEERQAHAFAIVVHELTTNAMKYGGLSERGRGLKVSWTVGPSVSGQPSQMVLTWRERIEGAAAVPERTGSGFGSRLIDASLKGELSGQIDREFLPDGLSVVLSFPVAEEALARNPAPRSTKHPRQPG
jgi:two-component sensor histidine kinase